MIARGSYKLPDLPPARTVVLDFLSNRAPREMSVQAVLAAGSIFGFSEQNLRMALARLVEQGLARSTGRGKYALASSGEAMRSEVRKWRTITEATRAWSGAWIAIYNAGAARSDRSAIRRHEGAMNLRGFRPLTPDLWLRPANLRESIGGLREHMHALGLHPEALVGALDELDVETQTRARRLWDAAALLASYRALARALAESRRSVEALPLDKAAAETMLLGRDVIRHINLDPLLPEEMMPRHHFRALVSAMIEYDEIGRRIWRELMRRIENGR